MRILDYLDYFVAPEIEKASVLTSVQATKPSNPRVLNRQLAPWVDFQQDLEDSLEINRELPEPKISLQAQSELYQLYVQKESLVSSEVSIMRLGNEAFERPVEYILGQVYGVHISFRDPRTTVNIGFPDRVITKDQRKKRKALVVVEWKSPWACDMKDLLNHYNLYQRRATDNVVNAVHKLYGYMTFNSLTYGILTNYESMYVFRRYTGNTDGGILECSPEIKYNGRGTLSPIAAYAFVCIKAYTGNWFHFSPTDCSPPKPLKLYFDEVQNFQPPLRAPAKGEPAKKKAKTSSAPEEENLVENSERVYFVFDELLGKNLASVIRGRIFDRKDNFIEQVIFKVYDCLSQNAEAKAHDQDAESKAKNEVAMYGNLMELQGKELPRLYAHGMIWNMLHVLILEDCGKRLDHWLGDTKANAEKALSRLHEKKVMHGDIAFRNIVYDNEKDRVRIIDLGEARSEEDEKELEEEMKALRSLQPEAVV